MEAEKSQEGPLKNNEIARFLDASKASYNAIDSVLSKRKEKSFQQRTLLEIASETESRAKTIVGENEGANSQQLHNSEASSEIASEEELAALAEKEAEKAEAEAQEAVRLAEEKKNLEEQATIQQKEKTIFDQGFAEGKATATEEALKRIETSLLALDNARKSILDLNASHFIKLRDSISYSILKIASERIGKSIEDCPEDFVRKIETLIESMGENTKSPKIYLNPVDLANIKETIHKKFSDLSLVLRDREDLLHGDIIIEIGSISLSDLLTERAKTLLTTDHNRQLDGAAESSGGINETTNDTLEPSTHENQPEELAADRNNLPEKIASNLSDNANLDTNEVLLEAPPDLKNEDGAEAPKGEVTESKITDFGSDSSQVETTVENDVSISSDITEEKRTDSESSNTEKSGKIP
ncbi:MAG: FliH/SctL family protein [Pseudomonadota bacterium]|nr:FliH/SctL family protein [Pseudomonadota bacterium]